MVHPAAPARARARAERKDRDTLLICGLLLAAVDALLVWRFPLFHYFPGPGVSISLFEIFGDGWASETWWYVALFTAQFATYAVALVATRRLPFGHGRRLAYAFPMLFAGLLCWLYPITAADLFHYLGSARTYWVYGDNPLTTPPGVHPFPIGYSYADHPSPYGPLWSLLTFPAATLSRLDIGLGLLGLKLTATASYLGATWLVDRILRRLVPDRAVMGIIAFAWNPFVVFRVVGNGHNDLVMLCFVLLSVYFLVEEDWTSVMPALVAAILVKYVAVLLLPALLLHVVQRCRVAQSWRPLRSTSLGALYALALAVAAWLPFWAGGDSFAVVRELGQMFTSTPGLLAYQLRFWTRLSDTRPLADAIMASCFLIALGGLLWRLWRAPARLERLVAVWYLTFFAALVLAAPFFRPWYFVWCVSLGPLLPGRGYLLLAGVTSYTANFADLVELYWDRIPWVHDAFGRMIAAPVAVQFLPATVTLLVLLVWSRSLSLDRAVAGVSRPPPTPRWMSVTALRAVVRRPMVDRLHPIAAPHEDPMTWERRDG